MSEPFLAEIRMFGFNFAPRGWAWCDGQILPIDQNQSLYSLLGTTYGGDGRTDFALPDLRGRVPVHVGSSFVLGASSGEEAHALAANEMPMHTHQVRASNLPPNRESLEESVWTNQSVNQYTNAGSDATIRTDRVGTTGEGQGHNNMQPFQVIAFAIALRGLFPPRN